ncbi:MAG: hypothetical protein AB1657_04725 [Candidatus Micrarchaeota archaeon]
MIIRYEQTKSKEEQPEHNGFPHLPQYTLPMLPHHYEELPRHHKDQVVWSYVPWIRESRTDFYEILALPQEERLRIYERIVLGHSVNIAGEVARVELKSPKTGRVTRSTERDVRKVISYIEENPDIKAEQLVGYVQPKVFSRLMLYIKFSGNNQASLRKFFEGLLKE